MLVGAPRHNVNKLVPVTAVYKTRIDSILPAVVFKNKDDTFLPSLEASEKIMSQDRRKDITVDASTITHSH